MSNTELSSNLLEDAYNTLARAFVLDNNSEWITVATGLAVTEISEDGKSLIASLHDEGNPNTILFSATFNQEQEIMRQQPTVVTWTAVDGSDVALSFENENGCDKFWKNICEFLGRPFDFQVEEDNDAENSGFDQNENDKCVGILIEPCDQLPSVVEFNTLDDIHKIISKVLLCAPDVKRATGSTIIELNYINRLLGLFRIAEDLENREILYKIFEIFKNIISLNNPAVLRELLSEQNVVLVIGVFEYHDPTMSEQKPGYRQFLLDPSHFKKILDFPPHILELIHQTFRAQYLKDVVLPRFLDEETFGSLVFMIRCNFSEIIDLIEENESFISKLIPMFRSDDETINTSLLKFMKEFLTIAKASGRVKQLRLYEDKSFEKFLVFIDKMLKETHPKTQSLATDVLINIIQHDPQIVRNCLQQTSMIINDKEFDLLGTIIDTLIDPRTEYGIRWQLVAILRTLLDASSPLGLLVPNEHFLAHFYPNFAIRLFSPLLNFDKIYQKQPRIVILSQPEVDVFFNVCELLCSFIVQHKYRIKYLLFRNYIVHNVNLLLKCQDKILRLCAIRIVRTLVGTGDDFYFRFLVKQSLLKGLIDESISIGKIDNSLSSALLEFFTFIRDNQCKILINNLIEVYSSDLQKIEFAPVYQELLECYNQINNPSTESNTSVDISMPLAQAHDTWSSVDQGEEAYFNSANDDDDEEEEEEDDDDDEAEEEEERGDEEEFEGNKIKDELNEPSSEPDFLENEQSTILTSANVMTDEVDLQNMTKTLLEELERSKRMKY